jgi:hypothetical protein
VSWPPLEPETAESRGAGPGRGEEVAEAWVARFVKNRDEALELLWDLAAALPGWTGEPAELDRDRDGLSPGGWRVLGSRLEAAAAQLEAAGLSVAEVVARQRADAGS